VHIILVSNRMATARSITLTGSHLALIVAGFLMTVLVMSSMLSYLTVRHAAEIRMPFLQELLRTISLEESSRTRELVRENLSNMAVRLGQMQGQLMQLDSLGERLAGLAGVKSPDAAKTAKAVPSKPVAPTPVAASGGPLVRPDTLNPHELKQALDELARQIAVRSESLAALEERIFEERIRKHMLPTARPVSEEFSAPSSSFGWRLDPFNGQSAMHEGVDFIAEPGTPILAAAAGVVGLVEKHPQYGNMVEIDHGNGLMTRYAHSSKVFVKEGELVKRGQKIAAVGSTGRSTGPHLHFEVRIDGAAVNPARFLEMGASRLALRK
jgi:murein DD-endopeptidase MepM/ murein hydrolase activator NlpD